MVVLMAGTKILGPVTIGDGARIGANAVVLDDVPAGALAVGNPARVIRQEDEPGRVADRDPLRPLGASPGDLVGPIRIDE